jgi:hypothetical protein
MLISHLKLEEREIEREGEEKVKGEGSETLQVTERNRNFPALKALGQCPLVLRGYVGWKRVKPLEVKKSKAMEDEEGKATGSEEDKALGSKECKTIEIEESKYMV